MTKKIILLNASPRKNNNTAQILESVMKGAKEAGAECELIHLTSLKYKGCVSCFACKRTGNKCGGLCIQKDDLRPVLEKILEADALVLGSPIYWSFPTGMFRNVIERLLFPILRYDLDEKTGGASKYIDKRMKTALIYTMNVTPEAYKQMNYGALHAPDQQYMQMMFGSCEVLNVHNTWQFPTTRNMTQVLLTSLRSSGSATINGRRTCRQPTNWDAVWWNKFQFIRPAANGCLPQCHETGAMYCSPHNILLNKQNPHEDE